MSHTRTPLLLPLVLLAPSEDKAGGGAPGALVETAAQIWVRERLEALVREGNPDALAKAFAVKELALGKARSEALALGFRVPLLPALSRYTGVAFQALAAGSLPVERWEQVYILSALRGLVRGDELVPPYKLKLAGLPGLKAHWRKALAPLLDQLPPGQVWDLLPGDSADLLKGWSRPRHTLDILDSRGKAISHFSKLYRGRVARWLLLHQEGNPHRVLRGSIPDGRWAGCTENEWGGMNLKLVVKP